jgi:hypothetical protein
MNEGPRFDELVGTDLPAAERERLLRVHELLIAAGPPPEGSLSEMPPAQLERTVTRHRARPRRLALVALAAAFAVAAFGAGFFVGDRGPGTFEVLDMVGTREAVGAHARLEVFDLDDAGNWPMELRVEGLAPAQRYELWLTKDGRLAALCGSFLVEPEGTTKVPVNAPYRLLDYDKWVVVREGSQTPLLST